MKRCIVSAPLVLGLMLGVAGGVRAMDVGVIGPTYEISEPHLLQMIEQRLRDALVFRADVRIVDAETFEKPGAAKVAFVLRKYPDLP